MGHRCRAAPRWVLLLLAAAVVVATVFAVSRVSRRDSQIHQRSGLLMGTFVTLKAAGSKAPAALDAAMAELARLERLLSYNDPASEVSKLNASAGGPPVELDPEVIAILEDAQRFSRLSGGKFDVTSAPLVDLWGFRPEVAQRNTPAPADIARALLLVDYAELVVSAADRTAQLRRPGMRVDLGGIAKGHAVDRVVAILREHGVRAAIVDVGGNVHALGTRPNGTPWRVGIQHPRDTQALLGVLSLTKDGVATSGDYQRFFEVDGRRYHHILDPHTGYPAETMAAISIVASSGRQADGASTAAFLLGPVAGLDLVAELGLEAILVNLDGEVEVTAGLRPLFEATP